MFRLFDISVREYFKCFIIFQFYSEQKKNRFVIDKLIYVLPHRRTLRYEKSVPLLDDHSIVKIQCANHRNYLTISSM